jgi:glycosyltransferase involved in cell wall biosynthesis
VIRVLSVIHHPFFGGPQNQVLRLAAPLRERGFSTLVVLPDEPGNAFERLSAAGVDVVRMPLARVRGRLDWRIQRDVVLTLVGDVPRLRRLIRREHIDLVVVHGLVNPQGAVAGRLTGRPVVWQMLETVLPYAVRFAYAPLVRLLASTVMATGRSVADAHPGIRRDAGRLFPFFPPVDTRVFAPDAGERRAARAALGFETDDVVVGCVTNFVPLKDLETFISVARQASAARSDLRFALLGRPVGTQTEYAQRVLSGAADLVDSGQLSVRDPGADVARHLRALDVFLATGVSEGIPTTLLESMSTGVAVVSTDVGGIREVVTHGRTGLLAAPRDRSSLTQHVLTLAAEPLRRHAIANAARAQAVSAFDVGVCADVHARAFEAALELRRRR